MMRAALIAACLLPAASTAAAQGTVRAAGRVARLQQGDTVPVPDARVVLHRIGKEVQGPLDSVKTDASGRFVVTFPRDTTALFLLSARNDGIEYFSQPLAINPARPDTALTLLVHDTSFDAPVAIDGRNIVISRPGEDGSRRVLELLVLRNGGDKARIAADTVQPSWAMRLPADIVGFDVGPGDISSDAVLPRGDSVLVFAPLAPGDKQFVFEYAIRGDRRGITVPFSSAVRSVTLLIEEGEAKVSGMTLTPGVTDTVQGKPYRRYTGVATAGQELVVSWPDPRQRGRMLLGALVGVMAAAVVFLTFRALRKPRSAPVAVIAPAAAPTVPIPAVPIPAVPIPADVIEALAVLDAAHAGRQADHAPAAWTAYLAERERLMARALGTTPVA